MLRYGIILRSKPITRRQFVTRIATLSAISSSAVGVRPLSPFNSYNAQRRLPIKKVKTSILCPYINSSTLEFISVLRIFAG